MTKNLIAIKTLSLAILLATGVAYAADIPQVTTTTPITADGTNEVINAVNTINDTTIPSLNIDINQLSTNIGQLSTLAGSPDSIVSFLGTAALPGDAKTVIDALNILNTNLGTGSFSNVGDSAAAAIGNDSFSNVGTSLSGAIGDTAIPANYGTNLSGAVNAIANGNSTLNNTGLAGAADHVFYVSPEVISAYSQNFHVNNDLCAYINGIQNTYSTSDNQPLVFVLAPALVNNNAGSMPYTCSQAVTLEKNVTLQSYYIPHLDSSSNASNFTSIPNMGWDLNGHNLTLQASDSLKGLFIVNTNTSSQSNIVLASASVIPSAMTIKEVTLINVPISISANPLSAISVSIEDSHLATIDSALNLNNLVTNSDVLINHSIINDASDAGIGGGEAIQYSGDNSINISVSDSALGAISVNTLTTLKAYNSTLANLTAPLATGSLLSSIGTTSTSVTGASCFGSYSISTDSNGAVTGYNALTCSP